MCKVDAVLCTLLQTRVSAFKVQDLAAYDMLKLPVLQLHVSVYADIICFGETCTRLSKRMLLLG